jgi:hypothetical protein
MLFTDEEATNTQNLISTAGSALIWMKCPGTEIAHILLHLTTYNIYRFLIILQIPPYLMRSSGLSYFYLPDLRPVTDTKNCKKITQPRYIFHSLLNRIR